MRLLRLQETDLHTRIDQLSVSAKQREQIEVIIGALEEHGQFKGSVRLVMAEHELICQVSINRYFSEEKQKHQFTGNLTDVTDQVKSEQRLDYLSRHDSLTGLCNQRHFQDQVKPFRSNTSVLL